MKKLDIKFGEISSQIDDDEEIGSREPKEEAAATMQQWQIVACAILTGGT